MSDGGLELRGISHGYRDRRVLEGLDLTLGSGVTALLGVNGAGKTTLLNIAAGAIHPRVGTVTVNGAPLRGGLRRQGLRSIALMPQTSSFPSNLTALEVVRYAAWMRGASSSSSRDLARNALVEVGLREDLGRRMGKLSGGMQRRVALAQAIATSPDILLLDEPSTGLDPEQRHTMVTLLKNVRGSVLLSSHVMEDVRDLADRIVILHEGRIRFDGSTTELEKRAPAGSPRAAEAGFLSVIAASA